MTMSVVYTEQIDAQIQEALLRRRLVRPENVAGFTAEQAWECLQQFAELHGEELGCRLERGRLIIPREQDAHLSIALENPAQPAESVASAEAPAEQSAGLSPVDQILAAPVGRSALDTRSAGGSYPGWLWWIVLGLGLPGGVVAWFVAHDSNPGAARAMLIVSVLVTVASVVLGFMLAGALRATPTGVLLR